MFNQSFNISLLIQSEVKLKIASILKIYTDYYLKKDLHNKPDAYTDIDEFEVDNNSKNSINYLTFSNDLNQHRGSNFINSLNHNYDY